MNVFADSSRIIITCNKRLSPYLEQEVRALGFDPVRVFQTGVELQGTVTECIKLNLGLRCASQVLYALKEFTVRDADDLYRQVLTLPWERWISPRGYFSVTSHVDHPSIKTPLFVNVKVKDAIADRFRRQTGRRPDSGPDLDKVVVHLFWKDERAEIFLDTSGETLAKHGYRKIPGKAPMLEALAAATVMATRWNRKGPFINPMCGSGTVAIEAVLLATNRSPALFRANYAFMHIVGYDGAMYTRALTEAKQRVVDVPGLTVIASDISEDAIRISRINAKAAGVESYIRFEQCDFEKTTLPENSGGIVFFNPEYGERLGEITVLETTYARLGDFMKKRCQGYTGYIFTGNLDLAKKIGLKAKRRVEFYSAKLDCRLLEYELYMGSREPAKNNEGTTGV